jgi:(2R)-ethylmalonyl-CoA mutase
MRTYAGHSTARESNELYRKNLAKGQTGLSVAFDLPTQTGYDPEHELSRGEVGKVGVSIAHKGDMHTLLDGIPLDEMNTSMTINATAAWLLALYMATAEENGVERSALQGTTQNDIIKEFLSRGTYAFPPGPSMRLIADMIAFTVDEVPKWNPINICSYHLQEAGATPVQEIAYSLSTAIAVLDEVRPRVSEETFPRVFGRMSFFVNAGIRFIEEHAKLRAMGGLWEQIGRERYGVEEPKYLRMRYGVQVNSLGLTEAQPENNIIRIVLEALAVTIGRDARARAIQLPAWNEALGLPRPWDQQWSLRIQQILASETDLLDYPDIFEGSKVMDGLVAELTEGGRAEMAVVEERGGAVEAVDYMKTRLVESHRDRVARIERGEQQVVGQNIYTEAEPSPLQEGEDGGILTVDPQVERSQIEAVERWRGGRDQAAVDAALDELRAAAADESVNVMPATIAAAAAGATTGEWAGALRESFGEYRAPQAPRRHPTTMP